MTDKTIILPPDSHGNGHQAQYRLTMMVPKRRYFSYLRERWWVVLVCAALALGAILAMETLHSNTYTSYAELYASGEVQLGVNLFNEESMTYYGTQIELLKSSRLRSAAFERMDYTPKLDDKHPLTIEVVRPMGTSLLQLQASGSDAALTQRFLQALIDEYLAYKKETRRTTSEDIVASLTDQLSSKEKDLQGEQDKLTGFQRSNNVAVLEEESKSAGTYLSDLNLQLAKLKLDAGLLAAGLDPAPSEQAVATLGAAGVTNEAGQIITNVAELAASLPEINGVGGLGAIQSELQSAKVDLAIARTQRDQVLADRGEMASHHLSESVTNLQQRVAVLEKQNWEDRKNSLDQLEKRIAAIAAAIPAWETKVLDLNERLAEGQRLKNNIQREQGYYDHLLGTLQNVDLGRNVQQERISVLQPSSPGAPAKRLLAIRVVVAVVFGVAIGLGLVFGWYLLDDRFVSVRDIKDQFGEVVLGLVPQIKIPRSQPEQALLQANDPRLAYAESFRHLRSALLLSPGGEKRPQILLFTGAAPAEGKTTVAMNLARVLAASGLRVALMDADPFNGRMHQLFGTQSEIGLLDYLRGEAVATAVVHATSVPGLEVIPIGTRSDETDGLFLRPDLEKLLEELKAGRDFLILDGPPILSADNAALLVPHADTVVLVVRPFFSGSHQVRQTLDMLYQRQAKQVTIVFNRARQDDLAGFYAQYGSTRAAKNGAVTKV